MRAYCEQCMEPHEGACSVNSELQKMKLIEAMKFSGESRGSFVQGRVDFKDLSRWKEIHFSSVWSSEMIGYGLSIVSHEQEARTAFFSAFDQGMERRRLQDIEYEAREAERRRKELRIKIDCMFSDFVFSGLRNQARLLMDVGVKADMLHPSEDGRSIIARVPSIPQPAPKTFIVERKHQAHEFIPIVWEQA